MASSRTSGVGRLSFLICILFFAGGPERRTDRNVATASAAFDRLPRSFELNLGQTDADVLFFSRGPASTLLLTQTHAVFALKANDSDAAVRMSFVGANLHSRVEGIDRQPGQANYFIGRDPAKWRTNVPTYARVRYEGLYPGVDLVFYGNRQQLEYDFIVAAGSDPRQIAISFSGADDVRIDENGDLVLEIPGGELRQGRPFVYQLVNGERRQIDGRYVVIDHPESSSPREVRFEIAPYDRSRTIVIDPFLEYSTYLGGSGNDRSFAPAIDSSGNVYVTGTTDSLDFPTRGPLQPSNAGSFDVFVTKLSRNGSTMLYSVYLGGRGTDRAFGIAVNAGGEVHVSGDTTSSDFPLLAPTQGFGGGQDVFVTKLTADGAALAYSTYLGGGATDGAFDVRLDEWGEAVVAGTTDSQDFPTRGAIQAVLGGARDIFVAKLRANGSVRYSTFLGGSSNEGNGAIWLDSRGHVFVTGNTSSTNFPIVRPLQAVHGGGGNDAFVSQIDAAGGALLFSTYLGGSGADNALAVTVDRHDNATITGRTNSSDLPTVVPLQARLAGGFDIFVAKLKRDVSGYDFVTYLGGAGEENAFGLTADVWGNIHLSGWTNSTNFPTVNALQTRNAGGDDAVFAALNPTGSALVYSTYFGGAAEDRGDYVVADPAGRIYVVGWTASPDFPTYLAMQSRYGGGMYDAFVVHLSP